jgi:hypothetical protein
MSRVNFKSFGDIPTFCSRGCGNGPRHSGIRFRRAFTFQCSRPAPAVEREHLPEAWNRRSDAAVRLFDIPHPPSAMRSSPSLCRARRWWATMLKYGWFNKTGTLVNDFESQVAPLFPSPSLSVIRSAFVTICRCGITCSTWPVSSLAALPFFLRPTQYLIDCHPVSFVSVPSTP